MLLLKEILIGLIFLIYEAYSLILNQYADVLKLAEPKEDGTYQFVFNVKHGTSMTLQDDLHHLKIIDFYLDSKKDQVEYQYRSPDQDLPCNFSIPWNMTKDDLRKLIQKDGLHRRVITVNNKTPGNPIVVPYGAEVSIEVQNDLLTESITLHIHGLNKNKLWWDDGVPYIQQCPIITRSRYTYRFLADVPGTHWYHGHMAIDHAEGLLGAFVVIDEKERELMDNYKREYVALLQDAFVGRADDLWYDQLWRTMKWVRGKDNREKHCWGPTSTFDGSMIGGSTAMTALTVNGKGWYQQEDIFYRPWALPFEIFVIKTGETIRLRFINGGISQMIMISIEEHDMQIVSADGELVQPQKVQMLIISPGERYDVLVRGKLLPENSYYIILETLEYKNRARKKIYPFFGLAILEYENALNKTTAKRKADLFHSHCTEEKRCQVFNCPFRNFPENFHYNCIGTSELISRFPAEDLEVISDRDFLSGYEEYFLNMHWDNHVNGWLFNLPRGIPYYHNDNLNNIAEWCDQEKCPPEKNNRFDNNCHCFYHLNITLGNVVQLVIYNIGRGGGTHDGFPHPFHIHGTHAYLMKIGYPDYNELNEISQPNRDFPCSNNESCNEKKWSDRSWLNGQVKGMNTVNPSYRDTITVPAGGYIVLRFRAKNPGWFIAHCHVLLHHLGGTAFAMKIGSNDEIPVPPENFPHSCGDFKPPPLKNRHKSKIN